MFGTFQSLAVSGERRIVTGNYLRIDNPGLPVYNALGIKKVAFKKKKEEITTWALKSASTASDVSDV
jgi:hypothetical protein